MSSCRLAVSFLVVPRLVFAQSPWERAASNLGLTFTGPLARSLGPHRDCDGGLTLMFGEAGAKRQVSRTVFGGRLALFAASSSCGWARPLAAMRLTEWVVYAKDRDRAARACPFGRADPRYLMIATARRRRAADELGWT
jgi:hypothetical protein